MSRIGAAWRALWAQPVQAPAVQAATQSMSGGQLITTSAQLEEFLKTGSTTASGAVVNPDTAMRNATVYGCVRLRAGVVANLPLDIKRRVNDKTRQDATDHPLWTVFRRKPNRWQSPSEFQRMLESHVLLRGNGYAHKVMSRGRVLELLPLNSARMEVKQDDRLALEYHYTTNRGDKIVFKQSEIFHLRGLSLDGIVGVSPITYAREAIGLAMTTEKHGAAVFKNGAMLGLVLKHPAHLGQEGQANLKQSLDSYRSGGENEGRSLILEEGMDIVNDVGMTSQDAQYLETRKFQRTDICMFYGVPPFMIGDTEKSTSWGAGIEQQKIGFTTFTAEDDLIMWEEAVNRDLVGENEPDIYARFNRSALLRGDIQTRWQSYVQGLQWGVMSPDEVRALEDMNPREDGEGGQYYEPPNAPGGAAGDPPKPKEETDEPAEAA